MQGLGWRTAHASSIDEKGLIYIFKATSAPPRAGTTGTDTYIQARKPISSWNPRDFCVFPAPSKILVSRGSKSAR